MGEGGMLSHGYAVEFMTIRFGPKGTIKRELTAVFWMY